MGGVAFNIDTGLKRSWRVTKKTKWENVCEALQTEIEFLQTVCPFNLTFIMFDHFIWEDSIILHIEPFCVNNREVEQFHHSTVE